MRIALLAPLALLLACPAPEPDPVVLPAQDLEVEIPAEDLTLEGTLALPQRIEGEGVPALVLVHGSGPHSRDSIGSGQLNMTFGDIEIALFLDISDAAQEAGMAVLRYDKRTCNPGNGLCDNGYPASSTDVRVSDFVADALAAAAWLAEQDGIDPQAVFVVGHSQGGGLMPTILDGDPNLAGGVSLAGNFRPIDALLRYQLEFSIELMEDAGLPQSTIDSQLAVLTAMVEALEELRAGNFLGTIIGGMPTEFWEDWFAIGDARPGLVEEETRPMLAINGDYDWNIPHDPELLLWEEAGAEAVLLPCVTHALNCVTETEIGDQVDAALLEELSHWVLQQ
ncbi:MAG: alpha/beta fold hydrolase [Myxococcota bacterium]|nr:alpha/beta fold hydrolase [Myxococcota bacterium]